MYLPVMALALEQEPSELGAKSRDSLGAPKPIRPLGGARRAEGWYAPGKNAGAFACPINILALFSKPLPPPRPRLFKPGKPR